MSIDISKLEETIGLTFKDHTNIEEALTHSSCLNETARTKSNERLEFLGDAILGAVLADVLFKKYDIVDEGVLTQIRSILVRRSTLADLAKHFHIDELLIMGKGEENCGGRSNARNLAGAMEAVIAAVYLDFGWDVIFKVLENCFADEMATQERAQKETDYKSELQELIQLRLKVTPSYSIINEVGPVHDRTFTAVVKANDNILGQGTGHSKKAAEIAAAKDALNSFS